MANNRKTPKLDSREKLIAALRFASIVEHTLCCEYLYAGFSMRRSLADFSPKEKEQEQACRALIDRTRPWLAQIYFIARQEMEHLAIATNLLAALGEPPYFKRGMFPAYRKETLLNAPYNLEGFSEITLKTFIWFERPDYLTDSFPPDYLKRPRPRPMAAKPTPPPSHVHEAARELDIHSVQELYEEIKTAFEILPATDLFRGDTQRQVGDIFGYRIFMKQVTNRLEAVAAINLIIEQGEGIGLDPLASDAHFQRFNEILTAYEQAPTNPRIDPALPVLTNPLVETYERFGAHRYDPGVAPQDRPFDPDYDCEPSPVGREPTREVMHVFNDAYTLMMTMLYDFFDTYISPTPPAASQPAPQTAKFYAAFFPLMTMVIRPLGEVLARMPAGAPYPDRNAGAGFEIQNDLLGRWETMSEKDRLNEYLEKLDNLADWTLSFAERSEEMVAHEGDLIVLSPAEFKRRMGYLHQNLTSTRLHLDNIWNETYK